MRSSLPLVKNGQAVPLFSWGLIDANGKEPSGLKWEAFCAFLISGFPSQKLLLLPEGTPDEIVNVYRKASRDMQKDPEFLSKRDAMIGEYEQITDAEGEILFRQATTISPEARDWVRNLLTKYHDVRF